MAEVLTPGGLQGAGVITEKHVVAWIMSDAPELASAMLQAGYRLFMHKLAGYTHNQPAPAPLALPPADVRLATLESTLAAFERRGVVVSSPRLQQGLTDVVGTILLTAALPAVQEWTGVAERAQELGYGLVGADLSLRTKLGIFVGKQGLERTKEKRLVNGTMRAVNLYKAGAALDQAIRDFFAD